MIVVDFLNSVICTVRNTLDGQCLTFFQGERTIGIERTGTYLAGLGNNNTAVIADIDGAVVKNVCQRQSELILGILRVSSKTCNFLGNAQVTGLDSVFNILCQHDGKMFTHTVVIFKFKCCISGILTGGCQICCTGLTENLIKSTVYKSVIGGIIISNSSG